MRHMTAAMPPSPPAPGPSGPCVAVLTAAGSGTRLGCDGPKALAMVDGATLLRRAAIGLAASGVVDHLVVTAPAEDLPRFTVEVADLPVPVQVVAGSPRSRQASVARGLDAALAVCPDATVVLVHDAARALTPPEVVTRVVDAVRSGRGAVVPALPVTDTVKEVSPVPTALPGAGTDPDPSGGPVVETVVGTPDRSRLRAVQTPQGFATGLLVRAHRLGAGLADDEAASASDDAGLVEALGEAVAVVAGDPMAFKVTTPLDLALAEVLAARP